MNIDEKDNVQRLMSLAAAENLAGIDALLKLDFEAVCESYNGIGPEFLPESIRAKVTQHLSVFEPAALIHDFRNEFSDGTRSSFYATNSEFLENCLKLADAEYKWYNPRRYVARHVAHLLYKFVNSDFGWSAWLAAKDRHAQKISGNSAGTTKE